MMEYKVETIGLTEKVYNSIKDMILLRELVPGQKLVQEEIASKLGVSRTPILSAFAKLEKEWLVKSFPRRGYYIYEMNHEEKVNMFEIRLRLEPLGASKAAEYGSAEDKRTLIEMVLEAEDIISENNFSKFNKHDYEFHRKIMSMSKNEMLSTMISSYNIINLSNQNADDLDFKSSIDGHKAIADAINTNNPEIAEEIMRQHIEKGYNRIRSIL